jgi:hypothetical protein
MLYLSRTDITDAGLAELTHFDNLSILELDGTQITDEGLKNLTGLAQLKRISAMGTAATDDGLNNLKERIPTLHVVSERDFKTVIRTINGRKVSTVSRINDEQ